MRNWRYKIDLKEHYKETADLDETDITDEMTEKYGKDIAKAIRESNAYDVFNDELESIATDFECVYGLDSLHDRMTELYDFADDNDIWVATYL